MINKVKNPVELGFDPTNIFIRQMTLEDIGPFCILFQNVFSQKPWNENWNISKINTNITRQMRKKGFVGMVASAPDKAAGYLSGFRLSLLPFMFYLDQLFVNTDYQGLNIGKRILEETETYLKSQGVSFIFLLTKPQSYIENFYTKNNYKSFLRSVRIKGKSFFFKHI